MSGTHLFYNGVLFRDCETLEYSSILEYDESGTHEKYMRTRVTVASTLVSLYKRIPGTAPGSSLVPTTPVAPNNQHFSTIYIPPVLPQLVGDTEGTDETTPARLEEIMERLAEPRKDFWYAVNGVTNPQSQQAPVVPVVPGAFPKENRSAGFQVAAENPYRLILIATGITPGGSFTDYVQGVNGDTTVKRVNVFDANNGPKPSGLASLKLYGGNVMRVQATFEVCRVLSKPIADANNPDPGYDAQKVRGVICNTWGVTDSLDDDGAVTHTVNGKIVVKDKRYKVNALRMAAFPLAFPYARLIGRQYTVDHSGLVLEYQYTYKQAGAAPPQGIRKYDATYTEMVGMGGTASGVFKASMNIKVQGWYDRSDGLTTLLQRERVQKMVLIRGAMTILAARISGMAMVWNAIPGQNPKTTTLVDAKVIEKVGHPELELQVTVNYGDSNRTEFLSRLENMGYPLPIPDYDPRWWPIDNQWGRLPDGNNNTENGDEDNPNFDNDAYPYFASGDPTKSDYFTGYFQPPGNNRHTLPRITRRTELGTDTSKEWARPGGFFSGTGAVGSEVPVAWGSGQQYNPISDTVAFSAIPSKALSGTVALGPAPFVVSDTQTGIAAVQDSGFHYVSYKSEVMNDSWQGVVSLPLSAPRSIPAARRAYLLAASGVGGGSGGGTECAIAVKLCAPKTTRVYSVSSTRSQKWGEIPEPKPLIVRQNGSAIVQVETLVSKEFLGETPELNADGITREFTHHARYTYELSNPWKGSEGEGGGSFEEIPVGFSPVCKATADQNKIKVAGGYSPLFGPTQYDGTA